MPKTTSLAQERLRDLELLLLWEGELGNARLRGLFGVQITRASNLIRQYRQAFPNACTWDTVRRVHIAARARPHLTRGVIDEYLALLRRVGADQTTHLVVHRNLSIVAPEVFREVHMAMKSGCGLELIYRSMRESAPHRREIFPHAIIQAAGRWHARAYVEQPEAGFHDFNLGRIVSAKLITRPTPISPKEDVSWHAEVAVRLVPHPDLPHVQQEVVRQEYAGGTAARVVKTRGALVPYLLQEQRIALDPSRQRPPEFLLAVENMDQVRRWLFFPDGEPAQERAKPARPRAGTRQRARIGA